MKKKRSNPDKTVDSSRISNAALKASSPLLQPVPQSPGGSGSSGGRAGRELRRWAEKKAKADETKIPETLSPEEARHALHELRVHQIELEMQNEELRRAQADLDAARARYFDLYDLAPVGYIVLSEQGLILEANLTTATLLGEARGALVKQPISRFIFNEDQDIYYRHRKQLFETGAPQICEFRMTRKNGAPFWARVEATAAQGADDGPVCRVVISDITDRKRAEEALEESEGRYRTILDQAADAVFIHDKTGRILDVNRKACQSLGYTREELLSKSIADFDPEAIQTGKQEFWNAVLAGETHTFESRQLRKNGSAIPVEITLCSVLLRQGQVVLGVARDIAERKRAEETMRSLSTRQEAILAAVPDIIMQVDKEKVYAWANPAGLEFFGEDVIGKEAACFFEGEQSIYQTVQPLFDGHEEVIYIESWQRRKDGEKRLLAWWCHVLKDAEGNVTGALSTARDITERKQAENLERAVYDIARAADEATGLDDLYRSVHLIIKGLMPAENFYVALYDEEADLLRFPYFVDEIDVPSPPQKPGKGLTEYVLRTGRSLLCDEVLEKELTRRGEVELVGIPSPCWLGAPLKAGERVIGIIAVQHYSDPKAYGEREKQVLDFVSGQVARTVERKRTEETLQTNLERFDLANRATFNAIWDWNLLTDALRWNENFQTLFGYRTEEIEPGIESWTNRVHAEDLDRVKTGIYAVIASEQDHWFDQYRFRRKDGTYAEVEDRGYIARDAKGKPVRMIGAMQDITERIRAEEAVQASLREKEILLREIHHRVKNNMQIISSLFNLQSVHIKDEDARRMLKEGQLRIRSMALVHEKLYQSRDLSKIDFADYLQSLSVHLFQFFSVDADRIRLESDLEDVHLDINSAVPCGLLVSELITNALKHAFPGDRKGVVGIGLHQGEDGTVELRVADDGVGFPEAVDFRHTESLGLQIVSLLVGQLEGKIELDRKNGAAFSIVFRELGHKAMA